MSECCETCHFWKGAPTHTKVAHVRDPNGSIEYEGERYMQVGGKAIPAHNRLAACRAMPPALSYREEQGGRVTFRQWPATLPDDWCGLWIARKAEDIF